MKTKTSMTISGLSKLSGIPLSTIKFYIRKNLLQKPSKTGKTTGTYTIKHLNRLKFIKKIQKEGNISLNKILEIIEMIELGAEKENDNIDLKLLDKKSDIINSAIPLFREKGFNVVTITDIVNASRIARATFYKYFDNKKDLFFECIQKILYLEAMNPNDGTDDNENDILGVFNKHAEALTKATPLWKDMINMLRAAAINDPDEFADKLDEVIRLKIDLYKSRANAGIQQGILREVNNEVLAVMILGIQEYCSEYLINNTDDESRQQKVFEEVKDIILHGILKK